MLVSFICYFDISKQISFQTVTKDFSFTFWQIQISIDSFTVILLGFNCSYNGIVSLKVQVLGIVDFVKLEQKRNWISDWFSFHYIVYLDFISKNNAFIRFKNDTYVLYFCGVNLTLFWYLRKIALNVE